MLNTDTHGWHRIAINKGDCAVINGNSLITIDTKAHFEHPLCSVVAMEDGFVVISENGAAYTVQALLKERIFAGNNIRSIAVGCGNLIFGVTDEGQVLVDDRYEEPVDLGSFHNSDEVFEPRGLKQQVHEWKDIIMIAATSKHVVAVTRDKTLVAAGVGSALEGISSATDVSSIYVSQINAVNLTFVIHQDGEFSMYGGKYLRGHIDYWNNMHNLHNVSDVIAHQGGTLVRFADGTWRWITYYGEMNYYEWTGLTKKYPDFVFAEVQSPYMVVVTPDRKIHAVKDGTGSLYEVDDFEIPPKKENTCENEL